MFEYYMKTKDQYHAEVYRLIAILDQDDVLEGEEAERDAAQKRLDELVELSKK